MECADSDPNNPTPFLNWNVCYLGGRQYFTDPRIGDFSITFSAAGGKNGDTEDGLHNPLLQLADVDNWEVIDVQKLANDARSKSAGNLCGWVGTGAGTQRLGWVCGVPVVGKKGFGIDSDTTVHTTGYAPGWCTMHVVQYQKPDPSKDHYKFDVLIFDANGTPIGQVTGADATNPVDVHSNLPWVMIVSGGNVDADPVRFQYAGQDWNSNDQAHHSLFGGYADGTRQGDTGFTC